MIFGCFVLAYILYVYRVRSVLVLISCVIGTMNVYYYIRSFITRYLPDYSVKYVDSLVIELTDDNDSDTSPLFVNYINVRLGDKCYKHLYVMSDNIRNIPSTRSIVDSVKRNIDKRNNILHCGLVNSKGDLVVDMTTFFRNCVYHFDKTDKWSRVYNLLLYIEEKYGIPIKTTEGSDLILSVYMNDSEFTEHKYTISELQSTYFSDILNKQIK